MRRLLYSLPLEVPSRRFGSLAPIQVRRRGQLLAHRQSGELLGAHQDDDSGKQTTTDP